MLPSFLTVTILQKSLFHHNYFVHVLAFFQSTVFSWNFPAFTGLLSLSYFIHNAVASIMRAQRHPENNVGCSSWDTHPCKLLFCIIALVSASLPFSRFLFLSVYFVELVDLQTLVIVLTLPLNLHFNLRFVYMTTWWKRVKVGIINPHLHLGEGRLHFLKTFVMNPCR